MGDDPLPLVGSCLKRIFRWRVPPNWSISDWRNEMRAEAACAAWQAVCDYDPSLGVPFGAFSPAGTNKHTYTLPTGVGVCLPLGARTRSREFQ